MRSRMSFDRIQVLRQSLTTRRKGFNWRLRREAHYAVKRAAQLDQIAEDLDGYLCWLQSALYGDKTAGEEIE